MLEVYLRGEEKRWAFAGLFLHCILIELRFLFLT
jgi:hypothetical protein